MSFRAKVVLYLVALHMAMGAVAFVVLRENRTWLLAVEALFLISIALGWLLIRTFFVPLGLIRTGADLISERDFTTHFRDVGQPELDSLIAVYNRMIDQLREERLKAEEQQQLLGAIMAASPSGIIICDFDGAISTMNPSASRLFTAVDPSSVSPGTSEVVSTPTGKLVRIHHGKFFDRGFERTFYLLEELTDELRASEKAAYEQLIRMVSHEVNNSVGAIRSLLESSLNYAGQLDSSDRPDFENALRVAISRMISLNQFVNGFADVVRLPAPHLTEFRLEELLTDIVTLIGPELEQRKISTTFEVDDRIGPTRADRDQLEQVVLNILRNAMESIGQDGSIEIALDRTDDGAVLRIADTGLGIESGATAKLFSPFFSTKRDGRGLGLTLIQQVLVQHKFDYSLTNRSSGGAEFRIHF